MGPRPQAARARSEVPAAWESGRARQVGRREDSMRWGVGLAGAALGSGFQTWPAAQEFSTELQRYALRGLLHQIVHLGFSF